MTCKSRTAKLLEPSASGNNSRRFGATEQAGTGFLCEAEILRCLFVCVADLGPKKASGLGRPVGSLPNGIARMGLGFRAATQYPGRARSRSLVRSSSTHVTCRVRPALSCSSLSAAGATSLQTLEA